MTEQTPTRTTTDQLSVPPDGRPYSDQPQWRNDFPIDWPQDEFVARRDFTKFLVLTSFAFVAGQVLCRRGRNGLTWCAASVRRVRWCGNVPSPSVDI